MPESSAPTKIWAQGGVTIHMGGIEATRRLLARCEMRPGLRVLDVGCGTGYTAVSLAQEYQAMVTAVDINPRCVAEAQARVVRAGTGAQVAVQQADAHTLPFPSRAFDRVIIESALIFCDAAQALAEIHRVLRRGGYGGANELTLLKPAPLPLAVLLNQVGIQQIFQEEEWRQRWAAAGFAGVETAVFPLDLRAQFRAHLKVDGWRKYLAAAGAALRDGVVRRAFLNAEMLRAARQFRPYVGYGLYVGQKEGRSE